MIDMNAHIEPDRHVPSEVLATLTAALARNYTELAGLEKSGPPFSLVRLLRAHAERKPLTGREEAVTRAAAVTLAQEFDSYRNWIPFNAISVRTMGSTPGASGGYLVGTDVVDPVDALRPWSVVASAGAEMMPGMRSNAAIPRTGTSPTITWIGESSAATSESPPTLGIESLSPKTAVGFVKISLQLLRQGEAAERFLRAMLLRAAGEAIDVAYFSGAGGVAPLGLHGHAGIGTQSGASLAHAGLLTMRQKALTAGAREAALQWVGPPAVQELLGARVRETGATGSGRFLWDDNGILGKPAQATKNSPASTLTIGDFSTSVVGVWGPGIRIDIDPSQDFNSAGLVARVMVLCDVAFPQPAAFTVATSIS